MGKISPRIFSRLHLGGPFFQVRPSGQGRGQILTNRHINRNCTTLEVFQSIDGAVGWVDGSMVGGGLVGGGGYPGNGASREDLLDRWMGFCRNNLGIGG